jgi:hypothetical protein
MRCCFPQCATRPKGSAHDSTLIPFRDVPAGGHTLGFTLQLFGIGSLDVQSIRAAAAVGTFLPVATRMQEDDCIGTALL